MHNLKLASSSDIIYDKQRICRRGTMYQCTTMRAALIRYALVLNSTDIIFIAWYPGNQCYHHCCGLPYAVEQNS